MRKKLAKYLTILFIAFIIIPAWLQPNFNGSIDVYNYWGKRGIVEVVYTYMQDYVSTNPKASSEKSSMQTFYDKFIKGIDNKSLTDIEKDYKALSDFLSKNSWQSTEEKMVFTLKQNLEKKAKLDDSFFLVFKEPSQTYLYTVKKITNNYRKSLHKFEVIQDEKKSNQKLTASNETQTLPSRSLNNTSFINYLWLIISFILGLIFGGLLFNYLVKHKIFSILKSETDEYGRILKGSNYNPLVFKFISYIQLLKNKKDEYKLNSEKGISMECVGILEQQIKELTKKNNELLNENIELGKKLENFKIKYTNGNDRTNSLFESTNSPKIFFCSIPEIDGTFKTENAKNQKEQDSFYKLELVSNTFGNIYFLSGDFDLRAIENIDYYLNPVCEVQNIAYRTSAKKIEMLNHGTIVFKSDFWQIKNKIKIKLV